MTARGSRSALRRRDGNDCHWCGTYLSNRNLTRDHVIPRSMGGTYHRDNLVLACSPCNHARGSTPYLAYALEMGVDPALALDVWQRANLHHRIITGVWAYGW